MRDLARGHGAILPLFIGLAFAALFLAASLRWDFGTDQAIFFLAGEAIRDGANFYEGVYDIKPPAIFSIYATASALFGSDGGSVRLLEVLILLATAGIAALALRHLAGWQAGLLGVALAVVAIFSGPNWTAAQGETFSAPLLVLGVCLLLTSPQTGRAQLVHWALAAAAFTLPVFIKPTLGGGLVALAVYGIYVAFPGAGIAGVLRLALAALAGVALAMIAAIAVFESVGAISAFVAVATEFFPAYDASPTVLALPRAFYLSVRVLVFAQPALALGILLLLVLGLRDAQARPAIALLVTLLLMMLLGVAVQGRLFAYHFNAAFVAAGLMAGWGWVLLVARLPLGRISGVLVAALLLGVLVLVGRPASQMQAQILPWMQATLTGASAPASGRDHAADVQDMIARYDIADAEPVLIWGATGPLFYYHGRGAFTPPTRFILSTHIRLLTAGGSQLGTLMDDLAETAPRLLFFETTDPESHLNPAIRVSHIHMQQTPMFQAWVDENYSRDGTFQDMVVYRRNDAR